MNEKAKSVVKNLYYTVAANFATLGISILLNLFVPKLLGVTEYGYWQLYVFYSSYVGFLHFGWIDGIYLKIGGDEYDELDKKELGSQFWYLMIFELLVSFGVILWSWLFMPKGNESLILLLTAIVSIVTIAKTFILYIFQSTNRIKEYAQLSRNDRYLYVIFIAIYFATGGRNFFWLIILDILSKLLITLWGVTRIKDMLKSGIIGPKLLMPKIFENINIGSKLMISNIASMMIMGTIRFFVQQRWSIEVFGKLSFTLSISNMFLTFINAIGIVMFPLLRRSNQSRLPALFSTLRGLFVPLTYGILLFYIPAKLILGAWLPEYRASLEFMGILFPIVIYEGRMSMLINTYLKTLRKEKTILFVNIATLAVSFVASLFVIFVIGNLDLAVGLILLSLGFRCNLAEFFLCRDMGVPIGYKQIIETLLTIMFIFSNLWFGGSFVSMGVYALLYVIYLVLIHRNFLQSFKEFRILLKGS
ncbi:MULTISPECIES: lipopolysaccharide biosynthesis protein [unclassified Enterococcus]|uniref:lipopolysaccharide biosynthesis protein n=1 Tax=unclassified Enterococcus TaxID=2608891 RepID=UPI003D27CDA1